MSARPGRFVFEAQPELERREALRDEMQQLLLAAERACALQREALQTARCRLQEAHEQRRTRLAQCGAAADGGAFRRLAALTRAEARLLDEATLAERSQQQRVLAHELRVQGMREQLARCHAEVVELQRARRRAAAAHRRTVVRYADARRDEEATLRWQAPVEAVWQEVGL